MDFKVNNIRCGGCVNTITKKIKEKFNIDDIDVNIEKGVISIDVDESKRNDVYEVLLGLGYPKFGDDNGFISKAKSFTSCAIGKIN